MTGAETQINEVVPPMRVLEEIQQRLLWLAVRMVDHVNRGPPDEIKVGGHQASSASMVSIMTALWFGHIGGQDKVAVKPHASPVYHAIKYLTGELDRSYLTRLRAPGGLQAYPSRTKDPDVADFSTGSVGLGAVAPLFSAAARRYVDAHFTATEAARFIAIVGDAELDEGNVWEAIAEPALSGLGNVMLIIDLNRQSLDRVIPDIQAIRLQRFFEDAGWHVVEAKYGRKLEAAFEERGGEALRQRIDGMSNEEYQSLFGLRGQQLRSAMSADADRGLRRLLSARSDAEVADLVFDLGGHDLGLLIDRYRECDAVVDRPSIVFAYTVKGWGLPFAGDPLNHAALLSESQIDEMRSSLGLDESSEWDRFDPSGAAGILCDTVGSKVNNEPSPPRPAIQVPASAARFSSTMKWSTQEAFGRVLTGLADSDGVRDRLVTASPDVSISTNLGGWINKMGVFSPEARDPYGGDERLLKWAPSPGGQHIELGISEMNLFLLLGQLGLAHELHGEMLLPVGTVYDPFVLRGLDGFVYSLYNGSRFVIAGTPSGVSLAPEGGAHQSTITPSVGIELPGLSFCEPAYATEVDWLLCDAISRLASPSGESAYLRLSTRPIDQGPFAAAVERIGAEELRTQVIEGGYRLVEATADDASAVTIVATGAVVTEAVAAAKELEEEGVNATVVNVTSVDRLYRGWKQSIGSMAEGTLVRSVGHLETLIPPKERHRPIVSVHDGASHALAWMGAAVGSRQIPLGVDRFGESGTIEYLYGVSGITTGHVVNAALIALSD
jgi:pyruvate dehydrogenase E1 component